MVAFPTCSEAPKCCMYTPSPKTHLTYLGLTPQGITFQQSARGGIHQIFLQFFHNFSPPPLPVEGLQNLSTILPQFFFNSSSCGRIWCIRIGLEKNCRRNNRRKIVETFGECRPRSSFQLRHPLYVFLSLRYATQTFRRRQSANLYYIRFHKFPSAI
jgi:hypothetical protein